MCPCRHLGANSKLDILKSIIHNALFYYWKCTRPWDSLLGKGLTAVIGCILNFIKIDPRRTRADETEGGKRGCGWMFMLQLRWSGWMKSSTADEAPEKSAGEEQGQAANSEAIVYQPTSSSIYLHYLTFNSSARNARDVCRSSPSASPMSGL
jgi:hypothetical protein